MSAKQSSFIKRLSILLIVQLVLLILLFILMLDQSLRIARNELENTAADLLAVSGSNLQNKIDRADNVLKNITLNQESNLDLMMSSKESSRFFARNEVFKTMRNIMAEDDALDALVIAENKYGSIMTVASPQISLSGRQELETFTLHLSEIDSRQNRWQFIDLQGNIYLYRSYLLRGRIVSAYISAENFLRRTPGEKLVNTSLILKDDQGKIWAAAGAENLIWSAGDDTMEILPRNYVSDSVAIAEGSIILGSILNISELWRSNYLSLLLLLFIVLIIVSFSIAVVAFARRQVILPMRDMTNKLQEMERNGELSSIDTIYGSKEFNILRDSFNDLLEETVELRLTEYRRRIELRDAELRSIRLLLKPHFFLNTLTTISNLSMQGKNEEIQKYIRIFSKNIRYMFKVGLHTVSLKTEMENVKAYIEMQTLRYPDSVFLYANVPEEASSRQIPQMLIHTAVENIYKHAVSVDRLTTILINIEIDQDSPENFLHIEIEDDGVGFPEQVLNSYKDENESDSMGLYSLYHMLFLIYGRKDLMMLENNIQGGATIRFRIPEKPSEYFLHGIEKRQEESSDV